MNIKNIQQLPIVHIDNASKVYGSGPGAVHAMHNVSCSIYSGEYIALCGPSGSGKSTLLNLMVGIDTPTTGSVHLLTQDLSLLNDKKISALRAQSVGFIFQFFNLLPVLTVFDNVYYPLMLSGYSRAVAREQVMEIINKVGLIKHYMRRPGELSGGQQQRVAIARALVKNPALVVADEPTGNLDTKTGQEINELLLHMNAEFKTTFVISTHSTMMRDTAQRVIEIEDGSIINDRLLR